MRRILVSAMALFAMPLLAASALDTLPDPNTVFKNRAQVHALVMALETEPEHQNAERVRALLAAHYKDVDYIICGQVLGPLAERKPLHPVMWQMIIASGDWVEAHPERAKDIDAYTLAGLESGARLYRYQLKRDPKLQDASMDALVKEYEANTLSAWNKAHPCRPD